MDRSPNRIKMALVDNGKTNEWLAEQFVKDSTIVSKWCINVCQSFLVMMMMTIAKLLNVDLNDLVRFEAVPDYEIKESAER